MANKTQTIVIDSILGGASQVSYFPGEGQFLGSNGIDPTEPAFFDAFVSNIFQYQASGLLCPVATEKISESSLNYAPMWFITQPHGTTYVYDYQSSLYAVRTDGSSKFVGISDAGELSNGQGNGARYYDNYVYLAKSTTVARYGPLNGTPTLDGTYWTGTLGKTALSDTTYPTNSDLFLDYPNHVLHAHSDGRLYIADVLGGEGVLHFISTTKTTVEGDTNNGSTYDAIGFGYNFHPSAMESYGDLLAVALFQNTVSDSDSPTKAKLALWDTVSQNINLITNDEFPDQYISAMRNVGGILYIVSCNLSQRGFRLSRYIGGTSFEEIAYFADGTSPFPGAVTNLGTRLLFGAGSSFPENAPSVYSYGLGQRVKSDGIFNIIRGTGDINRVTTSVCAEAPFADAAVGVLVGWSLGITGGSNNAIDRVSRFVDYSASPSVWSSALYNIGRPAKITKISFNITEPIESGMIVTPTVVVDTESNSYVGGTAPGLSIINNTNYPNKTRVVMRPENLTLENNFYLRLKWTGTIRCVVALPIIIEYEILDD